MVVWNRLGKLSSNAKFLAPRLRRISVPETDRKVITRLPKQYQKFYEEWQAERIPVHWIPSTVTWKRDPVSGATSIVRDRPIPVVYPHQSDHGIWGGEGVVEGLVKKAKYRIPVPRFWVPSLHRSVVYSEILDKYLAVTVTERTLKLIDQFQGFDTYLLQNPANELRSLLALKLKRKLLLALARRDFAHDDPKKHLELLEKYKDAIIPLDEIEWYGLSVAEAKAKYEAELAEAKVKVIQPLKIALRAEFIEKLKMEVKKGQEESQSESQSSGTWIQKFNPFRKPEKAV